MCREHPNTDTILKLTVLVLDLAVVHGKEVAEETLRSAQIGRERVTTIMHYIQQYQRFRSFYRNGEYIGRPRSLPHFITSLSHHKDDFRRMVRALNHGLAQEYQLPYTVFYDKDYVKKERRSKSADDRTPEQIKADRNHRRNQVRHQVLPLLRQLQPSADQALDQTIQHLQSVERLYNALLEPLRQQLVVHQPDGTVLIRLQLPFPNIQSQLLYELCRPFGFNYATIEDILSASQSGRHFYSSTHQALLDRQCLIVQPLQSSPSQPLPRLHIHTTRNFDFHALDWRRLPLTTAYFDADRLKLPLTLRHWHEGDRFQPLGMSHGTQLLSDFFSDHKYSLIEKQNQWLLVDANDTIHWIVGRRTAHPARVTPSTTTLLSVSLISPTNDEPQFLPNNS
jgi:tRNA(Ile)-lysidine synthetase-like protein